MICNTGAISFGVGLLTNEKCANLFVESSKHGRRTCVEIVAYAHIEVGLKI